MARKQQAKRKRYSGSGVECDNHSLAGKLDLRRHFLRIYHGAKPPPRVMDCCQGSGKLWEQLRREFTLASYWGMDVKPKAGRLRIDSSRVLAQKGWAAEVIDVDAYGSPWAHWLALLQNAPRGQALTVFLTLGTVRVAGGGNVASEELDVAGLRFPTLRVPRALLQAPGVRDYVLMRMLALPLEHGFVVRECLEGPSGRHARYFGLRLEPAVTIGCQGGRGA